MPELPEVEIVKRGLEPVWVGKRFAHLVLNRPDLRWPIPENLPDIVSDACVERLIRRGKYIVALLDNGHGFGLHLGMTGQVNIFKSEKEYKPRKHDHVVWHMHDGGVVAFNDARRFGMVFLVDGQNHETHASFKDMGPEPLGNDFSGPVLSDALKNKRVSIKNALLDQKVVAGVGNIYACEALHMSGIHPEREAGKIHQREAEALCISIRQVLGTAIEAGGSTLKDYQHTDGSLGYFQHQFTVYDREGQGCTQCASPGKSTVRRIIQGGRSTFFCSECQK